MEGSFEEECFQNQSEEGGWRVSCVLVWRSLPFASKPPGTFELMRVGTYRNKECIIDADLYYLLHASMRNNGRARAVMSSPFLFIYLFLYLLIHAHGIKVGSDSLRRYIVTLVPLLPSVSQFPSLEITTVTRFLVIFLKAYLSHKCTHEHIVFFNNC